MIVMTLMTSAFAGPALTPRDLRKLEKGCDKGRATACLHRAHHALSAGEGEAASDEALEWARTGCQLEHVESCALRSRLAAELGRVRRGDVVTVLEGFERGCGQGLDGVCDAWSDFVHRDAGIWSPTPEEERALHQSACDGGSEVACGRVAGLDTFLGDQAVPLPAAAVEPALSLGHRVRTCVASLGPDAPMNRQVSVRALAMDGRTWVRSEGIPMGEVNPCIAKAWSSLHDAVNATGRAVAVQVTVHVEGGGTKPLRARVVEPRARLEAQCAKGDQAACSRGHAVDAAWQVTEVPRCTLEDEVRTMCTSATEPSPALQAAMDACFDDLTTRRARSGGQLQMAWAEETGVETQCTDLPDAQFHECVSSALLAQDEAPGACVDLSFIPTLTKRNMYGN